MAEPSTGGAKWFSCAEKSPEVADRARLQGTMQVGGRDDAGVPWASSGGRDGRMYTSGDASVVGRALLFPLYPSATPGI